MDGRILIGGLLVDEVQHLSHDRLALDQLDADLFMLLLQELLLSDEVSQMSVPGLCLLLLLAHLH